MDGQESNERTPLIERHTSEPRRDQDERHSVQDLGPFVHQPYELYESIATKDYKAFHAKMGSTADLLKAIRTDAKRGLSDQEAVDSDDNVRISVYGRNALPERRMKTFWTMLWEAFDDKVLWVLTLAAIVSFALGLYQDFGPSHDPNQPRVQWVEGASIMTAIVIVVLVSSINDYQKERQFKKLNDKQQVRHVDVIRNGKSKRIDTKHVLVGDIIQVNGGDIVCADCLVLKSNAITCDETSATGESDAIHKQSLEKVLAADDTRADPFLLSGSKILEGSGTAVVLAVGQDSFQGRIFMSLRSSQPSVTRMQKQLGSLAEHIARIASCAGGLLFFILVIRFFVELKTKPHRTPAEQGQSFIQIFVISVTLIVVAVPEGLPLAVTLALAFATKRMTKHNLLVRVFDSCEIMANATCVVTDKTGTLTTNVMTVVALCLGDAVFLDHDLQGVEGGHHKLDTLTDSISDPVKKLLTDSIAINSTAFEDDDEHGRKQFVGSKTETGLLQMLKSLEWDDYVSVRDGADIVKSYPFSSDRKAMATVVRRADGKHVALVKGAAEVLVGKSTKTLKVGKDRDKVETEDLTEEGRQRLNKTMKSFQNNALRVLSLCYKELDNFDEKAQYDDIAQDLVFVALAGIEDPLRDSVADSVKKCHQAGIKVIMCTGDNLLTAKAIAKQCHILEEDTLVLEGSNFRNMSNEEQRGVVSRLRVLARSLPQDKEDLVSALRDVGEIVGATGDGTNDALALKKADVGFSMGLSGTEVAKEASDIVLMDDNFSSIVSAVIWGRCVSDAVRKFLQFQLAVNVTAIVITFVSAITSGDENSVLGPVQLLWVNLIMDTFAALALATDPADLRLLDRQPEPTTAPIINVPMIKMVIFQALYQILVTLLLHFVGPRMLRPFIGVVQRDNVRFSTLIFNCFVWCQIFNMINCRQLYNDYNVFRGMHKNAWLLGILGIMIGGQTLIVSFGGAAFETAPIPWNYWLISMLVGAFSLVVGFVARVLPIDGLLDKTIKRLKLIPNPTELPIAKNGIEKGKEGLDQTLTLIHRIRAGRMRSNVITYFHQKMHPSAQEEKFTINSLLMIPSTIFKKVKPT